MNTLKQWANRYDWAKLLLFALAALVIMLLGGLVIAVADTGLPIVLFGGMLVCGIFGYWLGNWKWLLIPVLAMLAEIIVAIPAVLGDPKAVESPVSIVLEAPFWIGFPAFVGAGVGYAVKILRTASGRGLGGPAAKGM